MTARVRSRFGRLDPRRSLTARLGWAIGGTALLLAVVTSVVVGSVTRAQVKTSTGMLLAEQAFQMADKLDRGMFERYRDMRLLASLRAFRDPEESLDYKRSQLEVLQETFPDYAWIGLTDVSGTVLAGTGGRLEGEDVSARPWFIEGLGGPFAGDVHPAKLLEKLLENPGDEPLRFVDVAAPVYDPDGDLTGVLGAHLSWAWAREVEASLLEPLEQRASLEVFVFDAQGEVLLHPLGLEAPEEALTLASLDAARAGTSGYRVERWPDGERYLTGYSRSHGYRDYPGLGWLVLTRQHTKLAFAPAWRLQEEILLLSLLVGLLFLGLGVRLARSLARPMLAIARAAERIRHGETALDFPVLSGRDEGARLSHALADLVDTLRAQKDALERAHSGLETTVVARTADLDRAVAQLQGEAIERSRAEEEREHSSSLLQATFDATSEGLLSVDLEGRVRNYNQQFVAMWRVPDAVISAGDDDALLGKAASQLADPDTVATATRQIYAQPEAKSFDVLTPKDGRIIERRSLPQRLGDKVVGRVWSFRDVTESRRAAAALVESEMRFRQLAENIDDTFYMIDAHSLAFLYLSPAFEHIWGRSRAALYDDPELFVATLHPDDRERVTGNFTEQMVSHYEDEYRIVRPDGAVRWVRDSAFPVVDDSGTIYRVVGIIEDVTARKALEKALQEATNLLERRVEERTAALARANERLQHDAFHDALTELPNRTLFLDRLGHALARARRGDTLYAVLFLDFDRFKIVNDSLGHPAGDALLVSIARRLETCLRPADTFARFGGDEFTVLLEDLDGPGEAVQVAERLHKNLLSPFTIAGRELHISTSIGIVLSNAYASPEEVLRDADIAMYRAKARGRAGYAVFDETMRQRAAALLTLEADLRNALERREFCAYYQPIVSVASGEIAGFEALVRWQHPKHGLVSPAEFIPIAEETGLIIDLDRLILREACEQMRVWQQQRSGEPLSLSVNLSSQQFLRGDLVETVSGVLADSGLAASSLNLEITESVLMSNAETVDETLAGLRNLGVRLHIDDFGTGYSSLSYLYRFASHALKIDRSFIANMLESHESAELVRTIVNMAQNLKLEVVAEGVETAAQLAQLSALGCTYAQGYLFAKPLPASEVWNLSSRFRGDSSLAPQTPT